MSVDYSRLWYFSRQLSGSATPQYIPEFLYISRTSLGDSGLDPKGNDNEDNFKIPARINVALTAAMIQ